MVNERHRAPDRSTEAVDEGRRHPFVHPTHGRTDDLGIGRCAVT
jgi:hypothetical protein